MVLVKATGRGGEVPRRWITGNAEALFKKGERDYWLNTSRRVTGTARVM